MNSGNFQKQRINLHALKLAHRSKRGVPREYPKPQCIWSRDCALLATKSIFIMIWIEGGKKEDIKGNPSWS